MDEIVPTTPDKVARVLDSSDDGKKSRLLVKPADAGSLLPLRSEQDLAELAFFQASGTADALSHQGLAGKLSAVASQGWRFHGEHQGQRNEIGLYGAYNGLTDPAHGISRVEAVSPDGITVKLGDSSTATAFAEFYTSESLYRDLEQGGYRFYDSRGGRCSAFEAEPGSHWVGDARGRWLPLVDGTPERLPHFQKLLDATRSADAARESLEAYEQLLEAPEAGRRDLALGLAAQGSAQARLAVEIVGGAEPLLESARGLDKQIYQRLMVGFLEHPDRDPMPPVIAECCAEEKHSQASDLAQRWLKTQQTPGAQFALEVGGLSHPTAQLALYEATRAHPGNPIEVARACISALRQSDGKRKESDIAQVGKTLLTALPPDAFPVAGLAGTALLEGSRWRISDAGARASVVELAMDRLEQTGQDDCRTFYRDCITALRGLNRSEDAYRVATALSDQLVPERKVWVDEILKGNLRPSNYETRAALYQTAAASQGTSEAALWNEVVAGTRSDEDASRLGLLAMREMKWNPEFSQAATLALEATRSSSERWGLSQYASTRAVYQATLASPGSSSGAELARLGLAAMEGAGRAEDAARIGATYLEALKWKEGTRDVAGLAVRLTSLEGSGRLSRNDSRVAVYRAALKHGYLSGLNGVVSFGLEALAQVSNQTDRARIAGAMLEELLGRAADDEARASIQRTTLQFEQLQRDPRAQADLVVGTLELMRLTGLEQAVGEVVQGEDWIDISGHQVPVSKPEQPGYS